MNKDYEEYDSYDDEKEDKKRILIIILFLLLILTIGVGGVYLVRSGKFKSKPKTTITVSQEDDDNRGIVDIDGNLSDGGLPFEDPDKLREALQQKVDESMLAIKINTNPIFPTAKSNGNLFIENSESNNYDFQVEITLDDTGDLIYTSPLVKPGQHILEDKLQKELAEGKDYKATAMFYAYDEGTFVGQAGASIIIKIGG